MITEVCYEAGLVTSLEQVPVMNDTTDLQVKLLSSYQALGEESKLYPNELKFTALLISPKKRLY